MRIVVSVEVCIYRLALALLAWHLVLGAPHPPAGPDSPEIQQILQDLTVIFHGLSHISMCPGGTQPPPVAQEPPRLVPKKFQPSAAVADLLEQARAQLKRGEYDHAAETIQRALRLDDRNPLLWMQLGDIYMEKGNAGEALGAYLKAQSLAAGFDDLQAELSERIEEAERAQGRDRNVIEQRPRWIVSPA